MTKTLKDDAEKTDEQKVKTLTREGMLIGAALVTLIAAIGYYTK